MMSEHARGSFQSSHTYVPSDDGRKNSLPRTSLSLSQLMSHDLASERG